MAHSIEYKNGNLTIPFSIIEQYIEGLLDAYHTLVGEEKCYSGKNKELENLIKQDNFCDKKVLQSLLIESHGDYSDKSNFCAVYPEKLKKDLVKSLNERVTECSSHIEKFQYYEENKGNDFVSFRIFDGGFYPYFETFLSPQVVDNATIHNHFMKSSIGTALIGYNVSELCIGRPINTRTFKVMPLTGNAKITAFDKIFGKLPSMLLNAFNDKKDLVVTISQRLLDELKVTSLESQKTIDPIKAFFLLSKELEATPDSFKQCSKNDEPNKKDSISKVVNIVYNLDIEEYRCGSAAFKIYSKVNNKTSPTAIKLKEEATYKLLEYVSGSKDQIKYEVNGEASGILNIQVPIKSSIADVILSNLKLSPQEFKSNDKLLIELNKGNVPSIGEFFHYVIEDLVKDVLLVESNITCAQRIELESQCALSFNIAGMNGECAAENATTNV